MSDANLWVGTPRRRRATIVGLVEPGAGASDEPLAVASLAESEASSARAAVRLLGVQRLTGLGVNARRTLPGTDGPLIWGARTPAKEGDWKYVNVRRAALFTERAIDAACSGSSSSPTMSRCGLRFAPR